MGFHTSLLKPPLPRQANHSALSAVPLEVEAAFGI
jgi:hypothetical protein